jgi:hypothetical protein
MIIAPTMFHPTKARYIIGFGQYVSQNNNVISKLKVMPKICAQLQIASINSGIHDVLS